MKIIHFFMALFAMMLIACNNNAEAPQFKKTDSNTEKPSHKEDQQVVSTDSIKSPIYAATNNNATVQKTYEDPSKKLIKTANLYIELKDYNNYNSYLHNTLKSYGAYVASEEQTQTDNRIENNIIIKVPVTMFDDLMNSLNKDSVKVLSKNISTTDVSAEIYDNKARAQSKKLVRDRYLTLLKDAHKTEEVLNIENEINNAQSEMESSNNRAAFLNSQAAYSTINIKYFQLLIADNETTKDLPFLTQLTHAFGNGASFISSLLIFFINIWPLLLGGTITWYVVKKYRSHKGITAKQTSV